MFLNVFVFSQSTGAHFTQPFACNTCPLIGPSLCIKTHFGFSMRCSPPVQTQISEQQRPCSADMDRDFSCQVSVRCSVDDFHWEAGFKQLFFWLEWRLPMCFPSTPQPEGSISPHGVTLAHIPALDHYRAEQNGARGRTGLDGRDYSETGQERIDQIERGRKDEGRTNLHRTSQMNAVGAAFCKVMADKGTFKLIIIGCIGPCPILMCSVRNKRSPVWRTAAKKNHLDM